MPAGVVTEAASSTACSTALAKQLAAAVRMAWNSRGEATDPVPVASPKIVSPSNIECAGTMARARPSCATAASLEHCAFVRLALVATTPIVVFSGPGSAPAPVGDCPASSPSAAAARTGSGSSRRARMPRRLAFARSSAGVGAASQSNSPGRPNGAPYSSPVCWSATDPTELTATSAATVVPRPAPAPGAPGDPAAPAPGPGMTRLADPMPPLICPASAPVPAPTLPPATLSRTVMFPVVLFPAAMASSNAASPAATPG